MRKIGIGIAGFGTIGVGVYKHLIGNRRLLCERLGLELTVKKIADLNIERPRSGVNPPRSIMSTHWQDLIDDPQVQVVVELMGGIKTPYQFVLAAIEKGKIVVTANKALLAEHGKEIFAAAAEKRVPIFFEAAAAGGVPIIKALKEAFVVNHIRSMHGIVNGTSNYILTRMTQAGLGFAEALAEAQAAGYAEADPTLDVNGWDAAHKAILLATLAYGFPIDAAAIHVSGIEQVRPADIAFANSLGYVIKLLAVIREHPDHAVEIRIQPSFIAKSHILASVHGVFNAVAVHGDAVGEALFYGRGAGQDPTASSVVADLVEAARSLGHLNGHRGFLPYRASGTLLPVGETSTAYYVRFDVTDRPGVIAEIARVLADHRIGISGTHSPVNPANPDAEFVDMVFLLHTCPFGKLQAALAQIEALDCVNSSPVVFRIEALT